MSICFGKEVNIFKDTCKIYGFGATRYAGKHSEYLLKGNVKPITRQDCLSILGGVVTPEYHLGMFCARGHLGVDACSVSHLMFLSADKNVRLRANAFLSVCHSLTNLLNIFSIKMFIIFFFLL